MRSLRSLALLALLAVAATLLFHHRVVFGGQTFQMVGDLGCFPSDPDLNRVVTDPLASSGQFEPWLDHLIRERSEHGRTPLWNPYQGTGSPFLANAQTAVYHPIRLLQQHVPSPWRLDVAVLSRFATAFLGMLLLCRLIGLSLPSAILGAAAFAFCGYFQCFANMVHLGVESLLPWHLLAIELALRSRPRAGAALFGASVLLSHLGGFPESTALCLMVALAYALVRLASRSRPAVVLSLLAAAALGLGLWSWVVLPLLPAGKLLWGDGASAWLFLCALAGALLLAGRAGRSMTASFLFATAVGSLLAAPVILPFLEFLSRSVHLHGPERFVGLTGRPLETFFGLFVTNMQQYGTGLNGTYYFGEPPAVGLAVGVLALTGAFSLLVRRSAPAIFFALLAFLATSKLFNAFFIDWIGTLPPLREIITRKYLGPVIALGFAGLAAHGLEGLRRHASARLFFCLAIGIASALLLQRIFALHPRPDLHWLESTPVLVLAALLAAAVAGPLLVRHRQARWIPELAIALLFVSTWELYRYAPTRRGLRALSAALPLGLENHLERLREQRIVGTHNVFPPNWSTRYAIQDLRFLDAVVSARYHATLDAFFGLTALDRWDGPVLGSGSPNLEMLDELGVRYVLTHRPWLSSFQSPPLETAVCGADEGILKVAGEARRGLRLPGGSSLYLGPLRVPRNGSAKACVTGSWGSPDVRVRIHTLGPQRPLFHTPVKTLERLRHDYRNAEPPDIATVSITEQTGGLEPDLFAGKPVLVEFQPRLGDRVLNGARLDVRNVHWDGQRLLEERYRKAQRLSTSLVPDEQGRLGTTMFSTPNRLWLPPAEETIFRCRISLNFDFPPSVDPATPLQLTLDARPVEKSVELESPSFAGDTLVLDLAAQRGETVYVHLEIPKQGELVLRETRMGESTPHFTMLDEGPVTLFENNRAQPIAYLVHHALKIEEDDLSKELRAPGLQPHVEALVSGPHARELHAPAPIAEPPVRMRRPSSDELILDVQPHSRALLVVLETYDPGWRVKVNGRPEPLVPVFGAFRGVYLEDGDRRVEMSYQPAAYTTGWILASVAAALALLWWLLPYVRRFP